MIESLLHMANSDKNGLAVVKGRTSAGVGFTRKRLGTHDEGGGKGGTCKKRKKCHPWSKEARPRKPAKSKCKAKKRVRTKPEAPFNSTQFIMGEHDNLNDSDLSSSRPRRHRDSSLSMESEELEEDCNSSSEEEKEFMTKQFWSAYEEFQAERLDSMTRTQLVQEYFDLEEHLTLLERELRASREQDRRRIREASPVDDEDDEVIPGEVPVDAETAAKIEIFRTEIQNLEEENAKLRQENTFLRRKHSCRCSSNTSSSGSKSSSSDSESDSDDSASDVTASSGGGEGGSCSSPLRDGGMMTSYQELEISETVVKGGRECDLGPDSGIASCSEGVNSSSGEDGRGEEDLKKKGRPTPVLPSPNRKNRPTPSSSSGPTSPLPL